MTALASGLLAMRALVQRNKAADTQYGDQAAPGDWQVVSPAEPCYVWSQQRRYVTGDGKVMVAEDLRAVFRADADIASADRFTLTDRRGRELFNGDTFEVEAFTDKTAGAVVTHREAQLRRYTA